jgi:DNA polymerase V
MSQRVMSALREFTPEVEVYSIDEAFMDLSGCKCGSLRELGQEIQRKVYQYTCIPVSVGIAETKTLAKLANYIVKQSEKAAGVLDLTRSPYQEAALERTPVEKVWGIGPAYAKLLRLAGIRTALALRDADTRWIRRKMTVVGAYRDGTARRQLPAAGDVPSAEKIGDGLTLIPGRHRNFGGNQGGRSGLYYPRDREAPGL